MQVRTFTGELVLLMKVHLQMQNGSGATIVSAVPCTEQTQAVVQSLLTPT